MADHPRIVLDEEVLHAVLGMKAVRPFLVTYWHDGPVDELRIVALRRVRA